MKIDIFDTNKQYEVRNLVEKRSKKSDCGAIKIVQFLGEILGIELFTRRCGKRFGTLWIGGAI